MASVTPTKKPKVQLIPWDPASPEHIQRLIQQRIACGWDREAVEGRWKAAQESGEFNLQWIVCFSHHVTFIPLISSRHDFDLSRFSRTLILQLKPS
jgi:hypothetical protein